jgi:F-type H+-transporting ATPase subunit gamma
MPSLKAIRRRIASVKNTQKITKAMKLVAAARLRRATQRILELRPYANKVNEVLSSVAARTGEGTDAMVHPLLVARPEPKTAYVIVMTSDRGLAGAYNANAQRAADRRVRELQEQGLAVQVVTIGRKGRDFFRRRGIEIVHDFTGAYEGGAKRAAEIARQLIDDYENERVDLVEMIYTEFRSAISQKVTQQQVLPVQPGVGGREAGAAAEGGREIVPAGGAPETAAAGGRGDFIFEPDRAALLARLLPMYVETAVYRAMLESNASEHGARMTAMDNATKNAKEMISGLTLQYNRARQAAITKELMEIIGGAEALKG